MIKKEMIFVNENMSSRDEVIKKIAAVAYDIELISNKESFTEAIYARETEVPTSIGHQVAIPHGKSEVVKQAFVAYLKTVDSFIWDEESGQKVNSIFLMGLPKEGGDKEHLLYLSQISRKLMKAEFRENLQNCETKEEAFALLETINKSIEKEGGIK